MGPLAIAVNNQMAALTWAAYDFALTFFDEVEYIWKKPLRSGTLIYLWVRYYGLATVAYNLAVSATILKALDTRSTDAATFNLHTYLAVGELLGIVFILSVLVILQARVYTIYMSKPLGIFNAAMWTVTGALSLGVWATKHPFACPDSAQHAIVGCGDRYPFYWIPIIMYHGWMSGLSVWKFVWRAMTSKLECYGADLVGVFLKDSAVNHISIGVVVVIAHVIRSQTSAHSNSMFVITASEISASRLVLHLRKAFYKQTLSYRPYSTIRFHQQRPGRSVLADESFWGDDDIPDPNEGT